MPRRRRDVLRLNLNLKFHVPNLNLKREARASWRCGRHRDTGSPVPVCAALAPGVMDDLSEINREAVRLKVLLRPHASTTSTPLPCGSRSLVYFDWQQHWSLISSLFKRSDVRYAACQHIFGRRRCKYCDEYWIQEPFGCRDRSVRRWPPLNERNGCDGMVFPLLLTHDRCDIGGEGSQKAQLAYALMPDEDALRLLNAQRAELQGPFEDETDEFEVVRSYQEMCKEWLATNLNDARLLYAGQGSTRGIHCKLLPLTFKLAQLVAPVGAVLELRVTTPAGKMSFPDPDQWFPRADSARLSRLQSAQQEAWESAVVVDVARRIVYTLDCRYFESGCPAAPELVQGKATVGRWVKDGGIPALIYAWLRLRCHLPCDVVGLIQAQLMGRDLMRMPRWLGYADADARCYETPLAPLAYLRSSWSEHDCLRHCHPEEHCAECQFWHSIDAEIVASVGKPEAECEWLSISQGQRLVHAARRAEQFEGAIGLLRRRREDIIARLRQRLEGAHFAHSSGNLTAAVCAAKMFELAYDCLAQES